MSLKLMYITNNPDVARIAENAGVDRIFIDMEYIGKELRQGGMDSVQNHHTLEDVINIKHVLKKAELLVRCNPIHDTSDQYGSSQDEIDEIVDAGADLIMLPYFKTIEEVQTFIDLVHGRTQTMLLLETPESVELLDEILALDGIDSIHIGLNDLSLGYHMSFMFELLSDGTVERLCRTLQKSDMVYGFGGIAALGKGLLPAEKIIKEHYRLGSSQVILSRSFCDTRKVTELTEIKRIFDQGIRDIRVLEDECLHTGSCDYFERNRLEVIEAVHSIVHR